MAEIKVPQPGDITEREREDAMGAYLMMFAAVGVGAPLPLVSMIASIIYFYINKKSSDFVAFHSFQSLITQIPITIINASAVVWLVMLFKRDFSGPGDFFNFLIFVGIMNLFYFIFSIVGAVLARKGRFYYFLFFGRIAFSIYYSPAAQRKKEKREKMNLPPKGF